MPYIRTSKGSRTAFTPARLSALLTLVWQSAYGEDGAARHRRDIMATTQKLWERLAESYGQQDDVEWQGPDIGRTIGAYLENQAAWEVHEAWLSLRITEFQEEPRATAISPEEVRRATQQEKIQKSLGGGALDPVWAVLDDNLLTSAATPEPEKTPQIGEAIPSRGRVRLGTIATTPPTSRKQQTRSQWISFWKWLAEEAGTDRMLPHGRWETLIHQQAPDRRLASPAAWWSWWQDRIDEALIRDPRLHELRRLASIRRRRNAISSCTWLDGSPLCPDRDPIRLDSTPIGSSWYRRLGVEHLKRIATTTWPALSWNWEAILKAIDPSQDERMTWAAWQSMDSGGALWPLTHAWSQGDKPGPDAKELPQWAFMRTAMALAVERAHFGTDGQAKGDDEAGQQSRTEDALRFYKALSQSHLVPAAAVVREAGKLYPKWLDDGAWWIGDDYSGLQTALHESAVGTAWMGSRALDVGAIRSRGAPVREGHRAAAGLPPILDLLTAQMHIQGREGVDRPITLCLPVWHRDLPEILDKRQKGENHGVQLTLLISDLFMKRAIEGESWTLFDPHAYPEAMQGDTGYLQAEAEIDKRKKVHPYGHRVVDANRLLKSCLAHLGRGELQFNFTSVSEAFGPGSGRRLYGRDGIGTFTLLDNEPGQDNTTALTWPALAVNLVPLVDEKGNTYQDLMAQNINLAFEMCERLYHGMDRQPGRLPVACLELRPACVGVIGLHEAVVAAREGNLDDVDDLMAWIQRMAMLVGTQAIAADAAIAEREGPAPAQEQASAAGQTWRNYHPSEGYERLLQARNGGLGMRPPGTFPNAPDEPIPAIYGKLAPRHTSRMVWAPFQQAARWAGVSPGGFGTLFPYDWITDEDGVPRQSPTPFLTLELSRTANIYEPGEYGSVFKYPTKPQRWPETLRSAVFPDNQGIKQRMLFASGVRPWIDQGVSMTLPANGLRNEDLIAIAQQAWWYGIDNLRSEQRTWCPATRMMEEEKDDEGSQDK